MLSFERLPRAVRADSFDFSAFPRVSVREGHCKQ
jgi:hypothetical protein